MTALSPGPATRRRRQASARPVIYVLSDSTGNLARHMLTAFLTQFEANTLSVHFKTFIRSEAQLNDVLDKARGDQAVVCHAMVSPRFKKDIASFCRKANLPCADLTGGIVEFLARHTGVAAITDVEALHRLDAAYRQRIGALEFTLSHDDGLGTDTLDEADIVLVGVSRTSKTPTSIFLAQQGYRVANVSLALEVDPPPQLLALPPGRIVGLTINPEQLVLIRTRRESAWRMSGSAYGDPDRVSREVEAARRLFAQHHWPVLNITDQAIEETAAKIVEILKPKCRTAAGASVL
jgi:[pyruvate, water dikinase]-phosphate phosphotransferase / [pyruvate, water dikinase] kinase